MCNNFYHKMSWLTTLVTLSIFVLISVGVYVLSGVNWGENLDPGPITSANISYALYSRTYNGTNLTHEDLGLLDPEIPTVVLIHGWNQNGNATFFGQGTDAFLERQDYNIIVVDYREVASLIYTTAVALTSQVADLIGQLIVDMHTNHSISLDTMQVVGHSLGAQIAGYVGKFVQNATSSQINLMVGLDPAGPFFWGLTSSTDNIAAGDGALVVCIHTDIVVFGTNKADCDIDFFPNGGLPPQPGCDLLGDPFCSHQRSTDLFVESVQNPGGFVSVKCDSWGEYIDGCDLSKNVTMGGNLTVENRGKYYCETNAEYPFSKE